MRPGKPYVFKDVLTWSTRDYIQMTVSYGYPPFDVCGQKLIPTSFDGEESSVFETLKTFY